MITEILTDDDTEGQSIGKAIAVDLDCHDDNKDLRDYYIFWVILSSLKGRSRKWEKGNNQMRTQVDNQKTLIAALKEYLISYSCNKDVAEN